MGVQKMIRILAEKLASWGLKLKEGSIEVLSIEAGAVQWELAGRPWTSKWLKE
jgi:hypothetical protein